MRFSVNIAEISYMNPADRLEEIILRAVAARRFTSISDFLHQAGFKSRGQIKSWRSRLEKRPDARIANISKMAHLLGMTVETFESQVFGTEQGSSEDSYPCRADAIQAARALQLPESAIQIVLREDPGTDPGRWYWFKRIESEAARIAPLAGILR